MARNSISEEYCINWGRRGCCHHQDSVAKKCIGCNFFHEEIHKVYKKANECRYRPGLMLMYTHCKKQGRLVHWLKCRSQMIWANETSRNESSFVWYISLCFGQSRAAVEHNLSLSKYTHHYTWICINRCVNCVTVFKS